MIRGAERGVKAVAAVVIADLPARLDALDAEYRDITLPRPSEDGRDVVTYQRREMGHHEGDALIEVFEEDGVEVTEPETDLGEGRIMYDLTVFVRVTAYNNRTPKLTESQMWDVRRRYEAALAQVFKANYEQPNGDVAIPMLMVAGWARTEQVTAEGMESITTTVNLLLSVEECPS